MTGKNSSERRSGCDFTGDVLLGARDGKEGAGGSPPKAKKKALWCKSMKVRLGRWFCSVVCQFLYISMMYWKVDESKFFCDENDESHGVGGVKAFSGAEKWRWDMVAAKWLWDLGFGMIGYWDEMFWIFWDV